MTDTMSDRSPAEIAKALRDGSPVELQERSEDIDLTSPDSADGQAPEAQEESADTAGPEAPSAEGEEDKAPADESEADDESEEDESEEGESDEDESDEDQGEDEKGEVPAWAQKELKKLRKEAGDRRTQLREAKAEISQLKKDLAAERLGALRSDIAREYGLPKELAKRLTGTTAEELKADAQELKSLVVPTSSGHLDGGLTPGSSSDLSPVEAAKAFRRRR